MCPIASAVRLMAPARSMSQRPTRQGNLYGTTTAGGASDAGTVFELTPSGGGWTKTTLYSFTGGNDATPTQVLVGNDGNLYGVASGGVSRGGVVFQLTPSGGRWTESVIHPFGFEGDAPCVSGPGQRRQSLRHRRK